GMKPNSFYKVKVPELKEIIEGCIRMNKAERYTIQDLLEHAFFQEDTGVHVELAEEDDGVKSGLKLWLRMDDTKKLHGKYKDNNAIEFLFELHKDVAEQVAQEMVTLGFVCEADYKLVAKAVRDRVATIKRKREKMKRAQDELQRQEQEKQPGLLHLMEELKGPPGLSSAQPSPATPGSGDSAFPPEPEEPEVDQHQHFLYRHTSYSSTTCTQAAPGAGATRVVAGAGMAGAGQHLPGGHPFSLASAGWPLPSAAAESSCPSGTCADSQGVTSARGSLQRAPLAPGALPRGPSPARDRPCLSLAGRAAAAGTLPLRLVVVLAQRYVPATSASRWDPCSGQAAPRCPLACNGSDRAGPVPGGGGQRARRRPPWPVGAVSSAALARQLPLRQRPLQPRRHPAGGPAWGAAASTPSSNAREAPGTLQSWQPGAGTPCCCPRPGRPTDGGLPGPRVPEGSAPCFGQHPAPCTQSSWKCTAAPPPRPRTCSPSTAAWSWPSFSMAPSLVPYRLPTSPSFPQTAGPQAGGSLLPTTPPGAGLSTPATPPWSPVTSPLISLAEMFSLAMMSMAHTLLPTVTVAAAPPGGPQAPAPIPRPQAVSPSSPKPGSHLIVSESPAPGPAKARLSPINEETKPQILGRFQVTTSKDPANSQQQSPSDSEQSSPELWEGAAGASLQPSTSSSSSTEGSTSHDSDSVPDTPVQDPEELLAEEGTPVALAESDQEGVGAAGAESPQQAVVSQVWMSYTRSMSYLSSDDTESEDEEIWEELQSLRQKHLSEVQTLQAVQKKEMEELYCRMGKQPPPGIVSPAPMLSSRQRRLSKGGFNPSRRNSLQRLELSQPPGTGIMRRNSLSGSSTGSQEQRPTRGVTFAGDLSRM
uniref:non-specific serine/threonine protein kinase n=1 Tax=Pelodiscus sinensis TaxID=13735 RepID=K7F9L0_PELSI